MQFRINTPSIIHEGFDDEVILLNLNEGIYYSLNKPGKEIWSLLAMHYPDEEISQAFETDQDQIAAFIEQLQKEKLIVPLESPFSASLTPLEKRSFRAPLLQVYHDMKELLLLDIIHEVDQAGWPVVRH